jgi:hypothetical protein
MLVPLLLEHFLVANSSIFGREFDLRQVKSLWNVALDQLLQDLRNLLALSRHNVLVEPLGKRHDGNVEVLDGIHEELLDVLQQEDAAVCQVVLLRHFHQISEEVCLVELT